LLALSKLLEESAPNAGVISNPDDSSSTFDSKGTTAAADTAADPAPAAYATPAQIGPSVPSTTAATTSSAKKKTSDKDIWTEDEVAGKAPGEAEYVEDPSDTRERPEYEIRYKQHVGVYDVYSGIDFEKDPSTMRCEEFVVVIQMPKTATSAAIACDVKEQCLDVRSEEYKLVLPLPRKVYPNKGSAKWDARTHNMSVTLVANYEHYVTKIL